MPKASRALLDELRYMARMEVPEEDVKKYVRLHVQLFELAGVLSVAEDLASDYPYTQSKSFPSSMNRASLDLLCQAIFSAKLKRSPEIDAIGDQLAALTTQ